MDLMVLRHRILMLPHLKTYGGLPVLMDNTFLKGGSRKWNEDVYTTPDYFVTGWFDTGSTSTKSYTIPEVYKYNNTNAYLRLYNDITDLTKNCADYWGANGQGAGSRTFSSVGRFIEATVYKPWADQFYIYDNTNHRYLVKGKNVT